MTTAPVEQRRVVTPAEHFREQQRLREYARRREHPGRSMGKPHGTYVTDTAERHLGVILCSACAHKFDPTKYHYYLTREFQIQGRCDGCREHTQGVNFFIHESLLGRKHGQCWWPR
jgi:hypothetical protein